MRGVRILIIGTEVTNGFTRDGNTSFFARELYKRGFNVLESRIVPDDRDIVLKTLHEYSQTGDIIITSGGLGPTDDDLTVDLLAEFTGAQAVVHKPSEERVRDFFARRASHTKTRAGFSLEVALRQARIPEGAEILENKAGLAPGIFLRNIPLFSFPGFPREIESMWAEALDHIEALDPERSHTREIPLWAISESGLTASMNVPEKISFGVHALPFGTRLFLRTKLEDKELLDSFSKTLEEKYSGHIVEDPLKSFAEHALKNNITFGTAESCTGGLGAKLITDIPGISAVYPGSVVSYANEVKEKVLGVSSETLARHGAVSPETAAEMARGAVRTLESRVAVSITGVAGPGGGSEEKPVGTVYIGIADTEKKEIHVGHFLFPFSRDIFRSHTIYTAFIALYQKYVFYKDDEWLKSAFGKNFTFHFPLNI